MADRCWIYDSMIASWGSMTGDDPRQVAPTFEAFCRDYGDHFFDGSSPRRGRCLVIEVEGQAVGQVNHDAVVGHRTELDIWLRSEAHCCDDTGSEALRAVCARLERELDVREFVLQPFAGNRRAVRSCEKAGFRRLAVPQDRAEQRYGPPDSPDPVYMARWADPGDDLLVRPMLRGEEEGVCELANRVLRDEVARDFTVDGVRAFADHANPSALTVRSHDNAVVIVALRPEIVGLIELRDHTHISLFFVQTACQREGIGRVLLREGRRWIPDDLFARQPMTVNSSLVAVPAYERLGFVQTEEPKHLNGMVFVPMERPTITPP